MLDERGIAVAASLSVMCLLQASNLISTSGDAVTSFDEISAAAGALGRFPGQQVMPLVKGFMSLAAPVSAHRV